ncbi:transposable element Tcb1 transposase [Trichonephila clavipes]|nr:transposable element Tcb1 transposase [Trichonephila clavipes]
MSGDAQAGSLWSSLEAQLQHSGARRHSENCFATVPFAVKSSGLIFQHDNARLHTERFAMNCLAACQTFPWPARPPDVSQIEHVRDMMGRRLHLPGNVDDLAR